jgi:hypothetical protein
MTPTENLRLPGLDVEGVLAALGFEASGDESGVPYTVIRGNDGPRWLIPDGSRMARAILAEWRPYGLATHFLWRGLRAAARCGALHLVPGTTRVRLPRDAGTRLLRQLGMEGDADPPVILAGNPQATRKLLVFLESRERGRVVIKAPLSARAHASIGNEAEVLKRLNGRHGAPRLLSYQKDTAMAMQTYLAGRLGSRRCRPAYVRFLIDLARTGEAISLGVRGHALREQMHAHARYGESPSPIEAALRLLEEDATLPSALVHGDFAPWNIREMPDGSSTLIDWEAAEWRGLPLHDLCHFFYMQTELFSPRALFYARMVDEGSWRTYFSELGLPPELLPRLAAAFLLETLARSWEAGPEGAVEFCLRQLDAFHEHVSRDVNGPKG